MEAWTNRAPNISHLRPFGCDAYAHVHPSLRRKLDSKARACIMLGYYEGTRSYRLLEKGTRKIVKCKDVTFDENLNSWASGPRDDDHAEEDDSEHEDTDEHDSRRDQAEDDGPGHDDPATGTSDSARTTGTEKPSDTATATAAAAPTPEKAPAPRRSGRQRAAVNYTEQSDEEGEERQQKLLMANLVTQSDNDVVGCEEAMSGPETHQWTQVANEEHESLDARGTWRLAESPPGRKAIGWKWTFKRKRDENGTISLGQNAFIENTSERYDMGNRKPCSTPLRTEEKLTKLNGPRNNERERQFTAEKPYQEVIGSFLYLSRHTRPDIAMAVGVGRRFSADPGSKQWGALSTTEAEYMALTEAIKEAIWMRGMLREIGLVHDKATNKEDNEGTIEISKTTSNHSSAKHIDTRCHYNRAMVASGNITLEHCTTANMAADVLTKGLPQNLFERHRLGLGIMPVKAASGSVERVKEMPPNGIKPEPRNSPAIYIHGSE
jgi:hypothetical protein